MNIIAYFIYIARPKTKPDSPKKELIFTKEKPTATGLVRGEKKDYTVYIKTFVHIAEK